MLDKHTFFGWNALLIRCDKQARQETSEMKFDQMHSMVRYGHIVHIHIYFVYEAYCGFDQFSINEISVSWIRQDFPAPNQKSLKLNETIGDCQSIFVHFCTHFQVEYVKSG